MIVSLDHVGFIVGDLEATGALIAQLGFRQTARADHTRSDERGVQVPAGSAQRSVMLHEGYIEFMQFTDAQAGHPLAAAPSARYGLHILALGTPDAQMCRQACLQNGVDAGPLLDWTRRIAEPDRTGVARFSYFGSAWTADDPSYLCWVEHGTPELLRSPRLLLHDNGAWSLTGIDYRGPVARARRWVDQLVAAGAGLVAEGGRRVELTVAGGRIRVTIDESATQVLPTAIELSFADCAGIAARCAALGLTTRELRGGALDIDLVAQLGMHWICRSRRPARGLTLPALPALPACPPS